jgi:predicted ATPase/signal transduction histidine kinase/GAF domain-containing protein
MAFIMDLTGYELEPLREDGEFVLYRARQPGNPVPVLARVAGRAPRSITRLEHEYALAAVLDPSWAARPLALSRHQGSTTLLLEDNGGEPLDRTLDRPLELTRFLRLTINLAIALGELHRHGLIHKDIKPANLLVDAAGNVRLTGFGMASRLTHERPQPAPPETIAGTFAYMAPEQTGRMNRSIDARSDLYSLGVTAYVMLTGALPFTASDPMEWIHCHIARRPMPPSERVGGIPGPVEAIILKLLAKNAEDRYQTAAGVAADLRPCLTEWEKTGSIEAFPLGAHDVPDVLRIPEKLYGREEQVGSLLAAFDRVVSCGTPELVLVFGYSGIGKSSVVNELHKAIVPPRGLFATGKFDQYKRDIPYTTLAQAFQSLVRYILAKSDLEVSQWRDALREALGPNGQLMVNLVPDLALIIGEQAPVSDLPPQDRQARFQLVFRRFLGVFARPEHPLVLFLDDLQWLDAATLELLERLVTEPEVRHLLLVGAYRDNEVTRSHPLMRTLEAIRKAGGRVDEVALAPLLPSDIERLVATAIHADRDRARPLAELVLEKTAGNPFFVIQFLTALAEEKLLNFDPDVGAWIADVERIRAKGYTDNVVDLMVGKLARLPDETQKTLTQLACLGNLAEVVTLSLVQGQSVDTIHASLWEAVQAGSVFRSGDTYRFLHDRVQEAAYSLIPQESRAETHLRIGRMLASRMTPAELADQIFDVVNQLNRGSALLVSLEEREQVAELNLMAGRRAKAATAYAAALRYFSAGRALLAANGWERCYQLMFELELNWAECQYLTGELAIAEERLSELSIRANTTVGLAAVTCVRINLYTNLDRSDSAVGVGLDYLRRVDNQWPAHATVDHVRQEYDRLWQQLGSGSIEALLDLPPMSDPDRCATMDVLTVLTSPALFTDLNLFRLVVGRMACLSLEHGNSDGSCLAYAWLGGILGTHFGNYQAGLRFGRLGLDLVERRGRHRFRARVYLVFAVHVAHWTQHLPTCRVFLRRAFEAAQETGDLTYTAYSRIDLITNLLASGDPLAEVEQEAKEALQYVRKVRFGLISDIIAAQLILIRILRGPTSDFNFLNDADFDECRFVERLESNPRLVVAASRYWIRKLQAYVHAGDNVSAVAAASKVAPLLWTVPTQPELSEYYFYGALARAARCSMCSAEERPQHLEALAAHRQQIAIWAENGPTTFANRLAMVDAEVARLEGRELDAERLYEEAIRLAREHGFIQNEGLANELAARCHAARGFATIADAYLRNARDCYFRWGADSKVKQLEQSHPHLRQEPASLPSDNAIGTPVELLDLATVVKVSQAISGEIDLRKLTDSLMVTALEHAGGERGLLIVPQGDELWIEAEAVTGRDKVEVHLRHAAVAIAELPESVLLYVIRTQDSVLLDDASEQNPYSGDEYIRQNHCRSILCLPLIKQATLIGVLYLENNLTPHAFTSARIAVLRLLASQAAISLENARLYADLQHAEAYLAEAQRLSHTGSFGWNVSSGEIFWSEESFRIFGYGPTTKPTVETALNRVHPDDVALVQQVIDRAANDKQDFDFEHRLLMPDESVKHVHVVSHPVTDEPGKLQFVGALMDITARKQAQAALERSEQRYRRLFRDMPVALCQLDAQPLIAILKDLRAQGVENLSSYIDDHPDLLRRAVEVLVVEEVNDYAVQMFGARDRSELLGSMQWLWRESLDTFRRAMESRYRGEELFQETMKLPTLDGRIIDVLLTVARPRMADDLGITLISLVDLTERVRAQEMLQRVQADFAHAARISMLGELAASIAHELNQPLAAITTNGEAGLRWLDRPVPDVAEVRQATTRMVADARRSADIIARIRGMAVRRAPEHTLVSLDELIREALVFLRHEAQSRAVTVSHHRAPGAPKVLADRIQLHQVIVNLAVNAMQAMAQAGSPERKITIRTATPDAATLCCTVEDSGPGIAPEHLDRLFDTFFTTKENGMGMGLSICRSIIEAHDGRIAADNESAHGGARFYFTLPAADAIG